MRIQTASFHRSTTFFGLAILLAGLFLGHPRMASAQYVENNLIDDNIFLNAASMGTDYSQIQTFLANRSGYLATYNTFSNRDGATVSAARIIYEAAQDYGLNPQVILATLQKEQSLVTATNPTNSQLNFAMGYGCADGTGCAKYSGFFTQVDDASWQLRMNFERARGNNAWWDSKYSFACGGATRYYSTGLYVGRNVTFYDDHGTPYKTFTLNDAATSSLYCYTPHVYPGSTAEFFSGSYNFVVAFEQWFGSTQPAIMISSPLRISTVPQGVFAGVPTTASFDLTNTTNNAMTVNVAATVRDSSGGNHDFNLKAITVPAHGTATYSDSQTFSAEDTYTFGLTSLTNGVWNDNYPVSSDIDNTRSLSLNVQNMPTVTVAPASNVADMRVGKGATLSFKIKNNSAQPITVGKVALALRGPSGENDDLPLVTPGSMAAGAVYTYAQTFTPTVIGTYTGFITATTDSGVTWNEIDFPAQASGVPRNISFTVKPSPTLTQGPTLSIPSPHVGQAVNLSFKVKNFSDSSADVGYIAMAVRDPLGRNVDPAGVSLTVNANTEYTFQASATYQTPGVYTAWVTDLKNGVWDDTNYPTAEDGTVVRKITFTVLPNPTITVQPTITTVDPRVGKALSATFTVHNYGDNSVNAGSMAIAVRGPKGQNVDFALQPVTIAAGSDYVYTASNSGSVLQSAGTYTAWVTDFQNGKWDDTTFPAVDSASIHRQITFTVKPSPTLTQGPALSVPSPQVGQQVTVSFKVKNYGDSAANVGYIAMAIRDPLGRNVDPGGVTLTINANTEYTFQASATFQMAGTYTAWVTDFQNGKWDDTTFPPAEDGTVVRKITFTVVP
ncbi:MAG TPA: hypothetical protein VLE99_00720 [Candidatus Saccharimonadales bacterium]|nr:hypothetical protein [Candidatus Saccharimonadales bacterium]